MRCCAAAPLCRPAHETPGDGLTNPRSTTIDCRIRHTNRSASATAIARNVVRTAARTDTASEVVGVLPGELVVTAGSGLLLTELLRGSLGDGCACCHPKK